MKMLIRLGQDRTSVPIASCGFTTPTTGQFTTGTFTAASTPDCCSDGLSNSRFSPSVSRRAQTVGAKLPDVAIRSCEQHQQVQQVEHRQIAELLVREVPTPGETFSDFFADGVVVGFHVSLSWAYPFRLPPLPERIPARLVCG